MYDFLFVEMHESSKKMQVIPKDFEVPGFAS